MGRPDVPPQGRSSPSSRRAWIEIKKRLTKYTVPCVALLAEGVDRNPSAPRPATPPGVSPSSRRAWIEIRRTGPRTAHIASPSSRRAWIEIVLRTYSAASRTVALLAEGVDRNHGNAVHARLLLASPSSRRAWIEIAVKRYT